MQQVQHFAEYLHMHLVVYSGFSSALFICITLD